MAGISFFDSKECEWADLTVLFAGAELTKIRGVKYKASQVKKPLHAAGNKPISIQKGERTYDGTITVLKGAVDDMNRAAVAAGGSDLLDITFDLVITYQAVPGRALQVDTLLGMEVTDFEKGMMHDSTEMEIALPVVFLDMIPA